MNKIESHYKKLTIKRMTIIPDSGTSKIILSLLFLILSIQLIAGDRDREGYVITLKHDTLHGFLLYRTNMYASKSCKFKEKTDGAYSEFFPGEIEGYRFLNGKYFVSKELVQDSTTTKPVFMEYLVNGIADLYYYVDNNGEHYYIEKEGFDLIQLSEKKAAYDGSERFVPSKYKGKLVCIMDDCPEIKSKINRSTLSHQSLIKLTKDYHQLVCLTDSCIIYEKTDLKVKLSWHVLTGVGWNNYIFGSELQTNYANSYHLGIGLVLKNLILSNERIQLYVDFLLAKTSAFQISKTPGTYYTSRVTYNRISYNISNQNAPNSVSSLAVNLDVVDLTIPIIINYLLPVRKASIIAGIGITNKFILSQSNNLVYSVFNDEYGQLLNTYLTGGVANIGINRQLSKSQTIGINFNYQYLFHLRSLNADTRLKENQFMLQLCYGFGGKKK
ncbi:MAG: hypothetical protein CVT99_04860 [Bacteroidetes bacterium HGW-Bacteroidetes-16]|nr:MAG: hypothetical protein CVT99_04860 [Bacteroidetes bacterium HGW-Bacteroidetes-16]